MLYSRNAFVIALVLALTTGSLAPQIPGIPGPSGVSGEYTSGVTGNTIEWTPDWMLGTSDVQEVLQYDQTTLFNPIELTIVDIFFTSQDLDATSMRDEMIEIFIEGAMSFQVVDAGDYGDIAYALLIVSTDDGEFGSFVLVNTSGTGGKGVNLIAPLDTFGRAVEKAQDTLSIDYLPVLSGIDGYRLQKQLETAPQIEVESTPVVGTPDGQAVDKASFTSDMWGYTVAFPAEWNTSEFAESDLDVFNADNTATLSFMAIENPGLVGEELEAELESSFMETVHPFGTLVSITSDDERAIIVVDIDDMILVQELVILSPEVLVVVTAFISGDLDTLLDDLHEVTLNDVGIFPLLSVGDGL